MVWSSVSCLLLLIRGSPTSPTFPSIRFLTFISVQTTCIVESVQQLQQIFQCIYRPTKYRGPYLLTEMTSQFRDDFLDRWGWGQPFRFSKDFYGVCCHWSISPYLVATELQPGFYRMLGFFSPVPAFKFDYELGEVVAVFFYQVPPIFWRTLEAAAYYEGCLCSSGSDCRSEIF